MAGDSWGLSWGGTTGHWLTSWASTFVPPVTEEPTVTAAGKSRRRKLYYVEIDGQTFEVADAQHAQALFDRAKEVAKSHAETLAQEVVQLSAKLGKKPIKLPTPAISSPNPELKEVIRSARLAINDVYRRVAIDTELAVLMARRLADEDEEESLILLI